MKSTVDLTRFQCQRCGQCCRVPGYVRLREGEAERLADYLGLDVYTFTERYTCMTANRAALSLVSRPDDSCVFLQPDNTCAVQPVKPIQCREFPHGWIDSQLLRTCPYFSTV